MRKLALLTMCSMWFAAGAARADALVGWGDSPTNGAPILQTFNCHANTGANTMVISVVPEYDLIGVTGMQLDLVAWQGTGGECYSPSNGGQCYIPPLPAYWDMGPGGCRAGAISGVAGFYGTPRVDPSPVVDPWQGAISLCTGWHVETGGMWTEKGYEPTSVGRLDVQASIPQGSSVDLLAGHEYYIATVTLRHTKSLMPGGCEGCCTSVEFHPRITLQYVGGAAYLEPTSGIGGVWQGSQGQCTAVPTRGSTWGAIKSAYR